MPEPQVSLPSVSRRGGSSGNFRLRAVPDSGGRGVGEVPESQPEVSDVIKHKLMDLANKYEYCIIEELIKKER